MERFPDHFYLKQNGVSIWVARGLSGEREVRLFTDPDVLFSFPSSEIIKDQKKITVGRVELEIDGRVTGLYLKRYNAFSWRYRLGSLFVPSGAVRSLRGAVRLMQAGFSTGRPIAAVEHRFWGMLKKSFYLAEEIQGGQTADAYWREQVLPIMGVEGIRVRRSFLGRFARLFGSLHEKNLYHNDLKDANILICLDREEQQERFYLLDLEGIRAYRRLSRRRRVKNLVQLNRTMGRFVRVSEKLYWLRVYLGPLFKERKERRRWIREILSESERKDRRSRTKR